MYTYKYPHTYITNSIDHKYISGSLSQLSYSGGCGGHYPFAQVTNLMSPLSSSFAPVNNLVSPLSSSFALVNNLMPTLSSSLTYYEGNYEGAHMFAQWTTTVPPEELTGPWDQGVSIIDGPSWHLRRNATACNAHNS